MEPEQWKPTGIVVIKLNLAVSGPIWCVSVHPLRADLPTLPHSTLRTLTARKEEAVTEAKQRIDHILSK
jgi:hypothetical protein